MKWTIGLLVILGVIAAICVVLLVNAFRLDTAVRAARGEVPVVLATRNLPSMSVLTADAVELGTAKAKEAPAGYFTSPAQVIGKILLMPVVTGQVLTKSCFISEGSGAQLAAAIPPGMRAVSVTLSSQSVSGGLLYPGCVVDVLASFKLSGGYRDDESKGEAISTTLLHAVQVLAIAGEVTEPETTAEEAGKKAIASGGRNLTVTLLVNPKQAEALQLAIDNGTFSLAMRNPLDTMPVNPEATVLSRGKLSRLGALLGTTVKSASEGQDVQNPQPSDDETSPFGWDEQKSSNWEVTVIRGSKATAEEVKVE